VSGDVTTNDGVEAIATKALAALGGLDILVNNAGGARAFLEGSPTITDDHRRSPTRSGRTPSRSTSSPRSVSRTRSSRRSERRRPQPS
jgi:NAD(P)-dependent dehydrogenase (short-subunit alcohol dehydrogenase family)